MCVVLIVPVEVADRDVEQNGAIVKAALYRTPRTLIDQCVECRQPEYRNKR